MGGKNPQSQAGFPPAAVKQCSSKGQAAWPGAVPPPPLWSAGGPEKGFLLPLSLSEHQPRNPFPPCSAWEPQEETSPLQLQTCGPPQSTCGRDSSS